MRQMTINIASLLFAMLLSVTTLSAQVAEPEADKAQQPTEEWVKMTPEEYIYKWRHIAIENMEVYGIPASITMGQAVLESGFGNGYLARVANNHFCIKCKSSWTGRTITHADDRPDDCFRAYDSVEASFNDHAEFLCEGKRYEFLFAYDSDDYKSWAKGLKQAGYATAPDYADRLIKTIERYHLYLLDRKDGIAAYDEYAQRELGYAPNVAPKAETQLLAADAQGEEALQRDMTKAYADKGIDPNNFRVTINSHHGYNVYLTNGAYYVVAKVGDSFASIGKLFEIAPQTLRKFNDLKSGAEPQEGDVVYIERKASSWVGNEMMHRVSKGETLHQLSQLYGIRLQSLSKLNHIRATDNLVEGAMLRLR
ncbi:MAG: glucosaminidase domain-containing protein [Alistipes sp.]|nr:glucosaminidase domain-containing protein [Alistipes sp.]